MVFKITVANAIPSESDVLSGGDATDKCVRVGTRGMQKSDKSASIFSQ